MSGTTDAGIGTADMLRFAELIEKRPGLQFDSSALKELTAILHERMRALRCPGFDEYLGHLAPAGTMRAELRELAAKLTIGETYFFRSPEQIAVFSELALPRLTRTQPARHIRILSAGCSTGEEPYALAMTLLELGARAPAQVSILGLDLNPECIAKARRGRYSAWAMRATPPGCLKKYFRRERNQFVLDDCVRTMVRFEERNLVLEDRDLWQPRSFDIIFCRNVAMYLSPRVLGEVVARFARVLTPDGFLFLGHAEPLRGISQAFSVQHALDAFYYVLRTTSGSPAQSIADAALAPSPRNIVAALACPEPRDRLAASFLAVSARSSKLIDAPASCGPSEAFGAGEALANRFDLHGSIGLRPSLRPGTALMEAERFEEALATLEALPPTDRRDPDMLLLMAMILMELGQLERATQVCASLLAVDDLNAVAHYVTALCHEQHGGRAAAVESYRVGVYLDRDFAMPHLRLGLMFRREGDLRSARREFENASILLAREDAARILLFGGGFSRSTLINLCASELRLCEGPN